MPDNNFIDNPKIGLIINYNFHLQNNWVCANSFHLFDQIIKRLNCRIISSQKEYDKNYENLLVTISAEPGWAAPKIKYKDTHIKYVFYSDPHYKSRERENYLINNNVSFVLSYYYHPFLSHFVRWPIEKIIHFPWSVNENYIYNTDEWLINNDRKIYLFGALSDDAYETRRWCKQFPFVTYHDNSGCENKIMTDREYHIWLKQFDCIVCAGSLKEKYQLVTPKYFETLASGALLFAQYCIDLEMLGFRDGINCVIFDQKDFVSKSEKYLEKKNDYLEIRKRGVNLIKSEHTITKRIEFLSKHIEEQINEKINR